MFAVTPDFAGGWETFYSPPDAAADASSEGSTRNAPRDSAICIRAILDAQDRHGIPDNLLLGIGLQEAGTRRDGLLTVWPWAVNAAGEGRLFENPQAAMEWVRDRQASGVQSIDVGCMQVNLRWHPDAFQDLSQGFDPVRNVDYAARFLRELFERTGDWEVAAGSYHSFTPELRSVYLASLERNLLVANERLQEFAALARSVPGSSVDVPSHDQPPTPLEGGFWAAALSDGTGAGRRGLYSRQDLQPILPAFRSVAEETSG
ncbi:transglycosylase SLT domain-containing protein [Roseibacterium sp. SDUM158016]|uniref:transglycosylase SLT domain-containing protein n=1 Tax=Roseicyclus sediminis TaxID=2980997 RepID=UPI0021D3D7B8|nr:transglycosylase SLT domain-containing protein [Roseibacterium sp. SDUM158016]MCU4654312.1 transglycosylase SLT domain-containing protein [Roseibacterium sp. SDUM158016]